MKTDLRSVVHYLLFMLTAIALSCNATESMKASEVPTRGVIPKDGFVPDKVAAVNVAIAVLAPIYGADTIEAQKPFVATLKNGVWTVVGSLRPGHVGGVAEIEISKASGKVLKVVHGK